MFHLGRRWRRCRLRVRDRCCPRHALHRRRVGDGRSRRQAVPRVDFGCIAHRGDCANPFTVIPTSTHTFTTPDRVNNFVLLGCVCRAPFCGGVCVLRLSGKRSNGISPVPHLGNDHPRFCLLNLNRPPPPTTRKQCLYSS